MNKKIILFKINDMYYEDKIKISKKCDKEEWQKCEFCFNEID